jgi:hypothetical protein
VDDFDTSLNSKDPGFSSLLARVETARQEASFIAKVSASVSVRTSPQLLLTHWARATVPYIAEWCIIDVLKDPKLCKEQRSRSIRQQCHYPRHFKSERR